MSRWLYPSAYPALALFVLMGLSGALLAWMSFGLVALAMANLGFLREHGLLAIALGGAFQAAEILLRATVALLAYLVFRGAEIELFRRWLSGGHRDRD